MPCSYSCVGEWVLTTCVFIKAHHEIQIFSLPKKPYNSTHMLTVQTAHTHPNRFDVVVLMRLDSPPYMKSRGGTAKKAWLCRMSEPYLLLPTRLERSSQACDEFVLSMCMLAGGVDAPPCIRSMGPTWCAVKQSLSTCNL